MQTSQAVSAGGLFTPGGVEVSAPGHAAPLPLTALAEFEQHMQQSCEGQAGQIRVPPATTSAGETSEEGAATLNSLAPAVSAATTAAGIPPRLPIEVTWSQVPVRIDHGEPTDEAALEVERPVEAGASTGRDLTAAELPLAESLAAAALMVAPPQRTPAPNSEPAAAPKRGSTAPAAEAVEAAESEGRGGELPARAPAASIGCGEGVSASQGAAPGARRSAEAGAQRSIVATHQVRPAAEPVVPTTPQAARGEASEQADLPNLRRPVEESLPAPTRRTSTDGNAKTAADGPGIERVPTGRRTEGEVDARRTSDVARFQAGPDETAALNAAVYRRASLIALAGTAAAKPERSMDKGLEPNQFAGLSEQKLPAHGGNALAAGLRPLGDRGFESVREAAFDRPDKGLNWLADGAAGRPGSIAASGGSPGGMEAVSGGAVRTAEQLLQNLTREVAQFKRFNAESMAVVLKPDAQTEIFLHLASRNGQIEIQARFERGDFASLNGQWAQLQQTLSQQGVRLSNLQEGFQHPSQPPGGGTEWGHGPMHHGQQRQAGRDADDTPQKQVFEELMRRSAAADPGQRPAPPRVAGNRPNSRLEAWA